MTKHLSCYDSFLTEANRYSDFIRKYITLLAYLEKLLYHRSCFSSFDCAEHIDTDANRESTLLGKPPINKDREGNRTPY